MYPVSQLGGQEWEVMGKGRQEVLPATASTEGRRQTPTSIFLSPAEEEQWVQEAH